MELERRTLARLVAARHARGMTQGDVAARLHMTRAGVCLLETQWKRGRTITLARLAAYAEAIDAELDIKVRPL